jgi:hypothetical protein
MKNFVFIKKIKISNKLLQQAKDSLEYQMFYLNDGIRDVTQQEVEPLFVRELCLDGFEIPKPSFLAFKGVPKHKDDDVKTYHNGVKYSTGFVHVVVKGRFTLTVGSCSYELSKGDVFIMNPNASHSVKTKHLCYTLIYDVPMRPYIKTLQNTQDFGSLLKNRL